MRYLSIAGLTAALSCLLTALTIALARNRRWVFEPRSDRWASKPVAKFGGVPIILTLLVAAAALHLPHRLQIVVVLSACMAALGLIDDIFQVPAWVKFSLQTLIAGAATWAGVVYPLFFSTAGNVAFTIFWLVAITNAFNLLDNMDGLSPGVGLITALNTLLILNASADPLSWLAIAFAGTLLGFLIFNFYPAKIFMGDTGSLLVGFLLACFSVLSAQRISSTISILFVPALVFFLPIFDMALVSVTRRINGRAISAGAKDHTSHRLVMLGLSDRKAVVTLYAVAAVSGLVAYLWKTHFPELGPGLMMLFLVVAALFWLYLAKLQLPSEWLSRTNVFTLAIPQLLDSIAKRAAVVFMDAGLLVLSLYFALIMRFESMPASTLSAFFLVTALSICIKIPLLGIYSVYRREWQVRTLRDIYPIMKACLLGSMVMVTVLAFMTRLQEVSRTVLVMDAVLSIAMLTMARLASRMFDDALISSPNKQFVLVGGMSAQFFCRYFEWKYPGSKIVAILTPGPEFTNGTDYIMGIPVVPFSELEPLLEKQVIAGAAILPDCPGSVRDFVMQICAQQNVGTSRFHFSVESLSVAAEASTSEFPGSIPD
jgi:UDP-GlcNAc:undecaprenyl-phosphate GlcNAc-1-phosphate transferase